jgi:two-component system KDP operon response regulator KdpE
MPVSEPAAATPLVLVVDDEAPIRRFLRATLASQGYRYVEAVSAAEAIAQAATRAPDLVLLDLGLPDEDGFEVVRRLREWSQVPVIVLSARGREDDKIRALDAGADDYVTKPFASGELLARMRVALRRHATGAEDEPVVTVGELTIDLGRRRVSVGDTTVRLTPIEYRLLTVLARHPGRVLTHEQLLRDVWGPGYTRQHHYLRVYMAQLRQKLEREPSRPRWLLTEPGVGYRLRED